MNAEKLKEYRIKVCPYCEDHIPLRCKESDKEIIECIESLQDAQDRLYSLVSNPAR